MKIVCVGCRDKQVIITVSCNNTPLIRSHFEKFAQTIIITKH